MRASSIPHPLLDLLARPNPRQAGAEFFEAAAGFLLVAGNAYLELVSVGGSPRELHALRPDRMKLIPGPEGWPEAYEYSVNGRTVRFEMSETLSPTGSGTPPPILHLALFHPTDDHYGFSPLEAAAFALDVHNAAARLEQGAPRQCRAAFGRARLFRRRRQSFRGAVRAA